MASTIKVNNIQNQCGANIVNKCSTTITLGASGDTIQLACGASQTGFGRTGTVDWDTTAKTTSFTAVSGNGYFVNTTSGAITMTLPATPSSGDIVAVADYANTFATNNLTVARNGSLINGGAFDYESSTNGISLTFVYVDGTRGWKNVNDGTTDATGQSNFIIATGGCVTCCGDYKIHTFTGPGTFTVTNAGNPCGSDTVDYLVVAGGGGGRAPDGGGGGAGGFRESSGTASGCYAASPLGACVSALPVTAQGYPITVGGGGSPNNSGSNSVFSSITSTGGGGGGGYRSSGDTGGSGGGAGRDGASPAAGNTPPVSPPQGQPGGGSNPPSYTAQDWNASGGGGGAGTAGGDGTGNGSPGPSEIAGDGGNGVLSSITGSAVTRGGGGGGASQGVPTGHGSGGSGGGGDGGKCNAAQPGTANTGGGGGGSPNTVAGAGGSGIVIIRYKYQ